MKLEDLLPWIILFLPLLASGGHHAVHAALQNEEQPHFHRRDCHRLRPIAAFSSTPTVASGRHETSVNWLSIGDLHVDFGLKLDALSMMMLLIVTGVGGSIHIYSYGYMHEDRGRRASSRS